MQRVLAFGILFASSTALAQALPEGTRNTEAASGGKTDIVADQFDAAAKDEASKTAPARMQRRAG